MNKYRCNQCGKIVLRDCREPETKSVCLRKGRDSILRLVKKRKKKA